MAEMPAPTHYQPLDTPLAGKRVRATEGAEGLGAAIARTLAGQGTHPIVADRDEAAADVLAREINGEAWEMGFLETAALESPRLEVDVLINTAGVQAVAPIQDFEPAAFHRILTLMLEVHFLLTRAALPDMYQRGNGRIINISSIHRLRASGFKSAYVAAKARA